MRKFFVAVFIIISVGVRVSAQDVTNLIPPSAKGQGAYNFVKVDTLVFFVLNSDLYGHELWQTNGTPEGTKLVADIYPGSLGSQPTQLTNVNGTLYFSADDGIHGYQLWKADGHTAMLVKVVNQITWDPLMELCEVNGILYFVSYDQFAQLSLWRSDGTSDGTYLVKHLESVYDELTNVNGVLFFRGNSYTMGGVELWKSDGTAEGTVLVKDINPGDQSSYPEHLTVIDNVLYFVANDGVHGTELWKSDGTSEGTVMVKDIFDNNDAYSSDPQNLTVVGNKLYFTAYHPTYGRELWMTDGTTPGTVLVKDITEGPPSTDGLSNLTATHSGIAFNVANDVWKSDGTSGGTVLIGKNVQLTYPVVHNDDVYVVDQGIWKIDDNCGLYQVLSFDKAELNTPAIAKDTMLIFSGYTQFGATTATAYSYNIKNDPTVTPVSQPVISFKSASHDVLQSSSQLGNQWYKDGVAIDNAVLDSLNNINDTGASYTVKVTYGSCASEMSLPIYIPFGVTAIKDQTNSVVIYPNPFADKLNIKSSNSASIRILNSFGTPTLTTEIEEGLWELNTSSLGDGLYFAEILEGGQKKLIKLIKLTK